jgi:hypothetical protein
MGFAFDFRSMQPRALRRYVASLWYARGRVPYARERVAPTGSTVAVLVLGDPIVQIPDDGEGKSIRAARGFLVGPHDRPTINAPTGETYAVGIVTTPVGCEAVFGARPAELRGKVIALERAWPAARALRPSRWESTATSLSARYSRPAAARSRRPLAGVEGQRVALPSSRWGGLSH